MNSSLFESLESRQLLSAGFAPAVYDAANPSVSIRVVTEAARAKFPNVRGAWRGSGSLDGSGDRMSFTMRVTQSGVRFSGMLTSRQDPGLSVRVSGRFTRGSSFTASFNGTSSAGAVHGQASGTASSRLMSGRGTFSASGSSYAGSFSFRK